MSHVKDRFASLSGFEWNSLLKMNWKLLQVHKSPANILQTASSPANHLKMYMVRLFIINST